VPINVLIRMYKNRYIMAEFRLQARWVFVSSWSVCCRRNMRPTGDLQCRTSNRST